MHDHQIEANAIKQTIDQSRQILIISHRSPDGDTVGAATALAEALLALGKEIQLFCTDPLPAYLHYLPNTHRYSNDEHVFDLHFDLVIVVDSGNLLYAGVDQLIPRLSGTPPIINIDHHVTNTSYGQHNLVIVTASSASEIVGRLLRYWNMDITERMANCLITGIVTDTSGLRNPATKHTTLEIAAYLTRRGADINQVYRLTHHQKTVDQLRLWGLALSRLKKSQTLNLVTTYINDQDLQEYGLTADSLEGLANYLAVLHEAEIVMVLKQKDDVVHGSLRTPFDHVDVSKLAQALGGGGHKKSAGFTVTGKLIIRDNQLIVE